MLNTIATTPPPSRKARRVLVIEGQALFGKALVPVLASGHHIEVVGDRRPRWRMRRCAACAPPDRPRLGRPQSGNLRGDAHLPRAGSPSEVCRALDARSARGDAALPSAGADATVVKESSRPADARGQEPFASGHPYVDPRVAGGVLKRRSNASARTALKRAVGSRDRDLRLIARGNVEQGDQREAAPVREDRQEPHQPHLREANITRGTQAASTRSKPDSRRPLAGRSAR